MMQELHEKYNTYGSSGLDIIAFPCNQFGYQEPGTEAEIKEFVQKEFNVQFKMMSKVDVNGYAAHPLYKFLKQEQHGFLGDFIKWNFAKFLINHKGKPIKRYQMEGKQELEDDIKAALDEAIKSE
eukprot:m.340707 g.340707  ORF g.340707 m.340707 type:complete len:125 (-) comp19477_c0_seq1:199-573(-)